MQVYCWSLIGQVKFTHQTTSEARLTPGSIVHVFSDILSEPFFQGPNLKKDATVSQDQRKRFHLCTTQSIYKGKFAFHPCFIQIFSRKSTSLVLYGCNIQKYINAEGFYEKNP